MTKLVVVFGAHGRLGQALLRELPTVDLTTLAVTREPKVTIARSAVHWVQIDVTEPYRWQRGVRTMCEVASTHLEIILFDLILDRRSVSTMRRSIASSTKYVLALGGQLASGDRCVRYVLASSTAALAPLPFQTPYGLAKRRQLTTYLAEAAPVAAALLPSLVPRPSPADSAGSSWCFRRAASLLAEQASVPAGRSVLLVPNEHEDVDAQTTSSWWGGGMAHLACLSWRRDDPLAHRQASHARLRLVPLRWRFLVDHHGAPESLVRKVAGRHHVAVERVPA